MRRYLLAAAMASPTCYTLKDIKDAECRVSCNSDGYDGGVSSKDGCRCFTETDSPKKKILVPRQIKSGQIYPSTSLFDSYLDE